MLQIILGIVLVVMALFLIVVVLLQSGSDKRLSGAISGAADTFLGTNRGNRLDKLLDKITPWVSGVFALVVIALYLIVS